MDQEKLSLLVGLLSPSLENTGRCFTMNNIINDDSTCIFQTMCMFIVQNAVASMIGWKSFQFYQNASLYCCAILQSIVYVHQ